MAVCHLRPLDCRDSARNDWASRGYIPYSIPGYRKSQLWSLGQLLAPGKPERYDYHLVRSADGHNVGFPERQFDIC